VKTILCAVLFGEGYVPLVTPCIYNLSPICILLRYGIALYNVNALPLESVEVLENEIAMI
jgi:hypothetical protein